MSLEALYLGDSKELHDIAKEYGKVKKIKIKTDRYGLEKKYAMICYATEDEPQKAIEGIKNKEGWTAERYKIKWGIKDQENKKYNKGNRINSGTTENLERQCYACNSNDHEIRNCNKKQNIFITNKEGTSAKQLRHIMEEYGNVTRNKIRSGNGYQVKAVMVCYSEKEEAEIAIKEINKYTGWRAEEYRIQTDK